MVDRTISKVDHEKFKTFSTHLISINGKDDFDTKLLIRGLWLDGGNLGGGYPCVKSFLQVIPASC